MKYDLPVDYTQKNGKQRREIREQYVQEQKGCCYWCKGSLSETAPTEITSQKINWDLFPPFFLRYPVHLQHDHETGLTEGAVHSYCNAVMWQYHQR